MNNLQIALNSVFQGRKNVKFRWLSTGLKKRKIILNKSYQQVDFLQALICKIKIARHKSAGDK